MLDYKAIRKKHGLTQKDVAVAIGTAQSNISAYEAGILFRSDNFHEFYVALDAEAPSVNVSNGDWRRMRLFAGLTQHDMAIACQTHQSAICHFEVGRKCLGAALQSKLEAAYSSLSPSSAPASPVPLPFRSRRRISMGLTQKQVADMAGVHSSSAVSKWENSEFFTCRLLEELYSSWPPEVCTRLPSSDLARIRLAQDSSKLEGIRRSYNKKSAKYYEFLVPGREMSEFEEGRPVSYEHMLYLERYYRRFFRTASSDPEVFEELVGCPPGAAGFGDNDAELLALEELISSFERTCQ